MKRPVVALSIIILATVAACTPTRAQVATIPHENPASAESLIETASFLLHLPEITTLLSPEKGEGLTELIKDSQYSHIAQDISYVVDRYQSVAPEMMQRLDSLSNDLDTASLLFDQQRIGDAAQQLRQTEQLLSRQEMEIQYLDRYANELSDLWQKAETLANSLGIDTGPARSKVEELNAILGGTLGQLADVKDKYDTLERGLSKTLSETQLRVAVPDEAHPGWPIVIQGDASTAEGSPAGRRSVLIFLDHQDDPLAKAETDTQGHFKAEITLGPDTTLGEHTLTIEVEFKGSYAGASKDTILHVVKAPCMLNIRAPARIMLPTTLAIQGTVSSDLGPLREAEITLTLGKVSRQVRTSTEGAFHTSFLIIVPLDAPLDLTLAGFQELKVEVKPAEPWHAPTQAKVDILIINPVHVGLIAVPLLAGVVVASIRLVGRRKEGVEIVEAGPPPERPAELAPRLPSEVRLMGIIGRILEAYVKAMRLVEDATRVTMKPDRTLREFLAESQARLNGAAKAFRELTIAAERALYSPHAMDAEEAARAENLAVRIEEALKGGAP